MPLKVDPVILKDVGAHGSVAVASGLSGMHNPCSAWFPWYPLGPHKYNSVDGTDLVIGVEDTSNSSFHRYVVGDASLLSSHKSDPSGGVGDTPKPM